MAPVSPSLAESTAGYQARNSAGGLGSLDFGLQRTLPDIDFPPPHPPLSSLHFGPRPLLSPSFSLTLNIVVGFAILLALIAPRSLILPIRPSLCPSFSPLLIVLLFLLFSVLFISHSERVLAQAATNLAPPHKMCQGLARSTALVRTRIRIVLFSACTTGVFNFPQGGSRLAGITRPVQDLCFYLMEFYSISGG